MSKIKFSLTQFLTSFFLLSTCLYSQEKFQSATVAFYNVENLFDTEMSAGYIDGTLTYTDPNYHISIKQSEIPNYDTVRFNERYTYENIEGKKIIRPLILQDEFSPNGKKVWTTERYQQKLKNLSHVISQLGKEESNTAPVIVGLVEIENRQTVQDLIDQSELKSYNYGITHFNSFDARGVDVAMIYQKNRFQVTEAKPYVIEIYNDDGTRDYTRDILRVTGVLDHDQEITFLVNHWPSRRGGEKASQPRREKAAEIMKGIYDEIRSQNPDAKIIAMGDFNDDPVSPSISKTLGAIGNKENAKKTDIVDLMMPLFKKGMGTLAYRDSWNLFDQFFVTGTLIDKNKKFEDYKVYKTEIFSPSYLKTPEGQYKGYPYRMYGGDTYYPNGYSDHFPVYTILLRKVK